MARQQSQILKFLSLAAILLVVQGCTTLGPDYEEPELRWLEQWQTDLYGQAVAPGQQTEADLRFWWRLFDDPVLNRLVELARGENPSLRIAGLRIQESRALAGMAVSARYPQVQQASGAVTYINTQQSGGPDQSLVTYQAGFGIGWELDFWGRFQRSIESADAAYFASISNEQDAQVLLSAQVADLYFAYRTVLLRIWIARKNAAIQKRSFEITERLYTSGQSSELDLQQAKTQYMSTLSTIPALEISQTQLRNGLCALLGRGPGDLPELPDTEALLPAVEPEAIRDVPARLLMRRPDVRAAAWLVAAQSAQIGIAEAELYPSISLLGNLGWSGNSTGGGNDTISLGIGPALTWNLFDHGRIRNNIRVQEARLEQAVVGFQNTVLQAAREIDDAAISIVKTREQMLPLGESVRAAERTLQLANTRFSEGYADFQRVIDGQRAMAYQAEREIINQGAHIQAVISFYKALGGGWQPIPEESNDE